MIRSLLTGRPAVAIVSGVVIYALTSGWLKGRALDACRSQWIDAGNAAQTLALENQAAELEAFNKRLRQQLAAVANERDEQARQRRRAEAAKQAANRRLNELESNPKSMEFLDRRWPVDIAQWVCASTGRGSGCIDEDGRQHSADP